MTNTQTLIPLDTWIPTTWPDFLEMIEDPAYEKQEEAIANHEKAIARHEEAIARHEETLTPLDEQMIQTNLRLAQAAEMIQELGQFQRESHKRMDRIQEEIQRIWEYLSSQSGNGRGTN